MCEHRRLIILTPMNEEYRVLQDIVANLGYSKNDLEALYRSKALSVYETGMGGFNMMNFIYSLPELRSDTPVDILLTGFAGALSAELKTGKTYQIAKITDFSFIEYQGAGDFEIIQTPSPFYAKKLQRQNNSLPHFTLNTTELGEKKAYTLISSPALLQGKKTKEYLVANAVDIVDMEAFALASALHNISNQQHNSTNTQQHTIRLDVLKVITDSPEETFAFDRLPEYMNFLKNSALLQTFLKTKLAQC